MGRKQPPVVELAQIRPTCSSCAAWERYPAEGSIRSTVGVCRLGPATPVVLNDDIVSVNPEMGEDEWCMKQVPKQ